MKHHIDLNQSVNPATLERASQVGRFLRKLLAEAHHLQAEQISFTLGQDSCEVVLLRDRGELKRHEVKPEWFSLVLQWFNERRTPLVASKQVDGNKNEQDFSARARVGEVITTMRVSLSTMLNGKARISISRMNSRAVDREFEDLTLVGNALVMLPAMFAERSGVLVITARDDEALQQILPICLSYSDGVFAGSMEAFSGSRTPELLEVLKHSLHFVVARGLDPVEVLSGISMSGPAHLIDNLQGIVTLGEVRKVCDGCARSTVIEPRIREMLPEEIRPVEGSVYRVGLGCNRCGETGFSGTTIVESVVLADDPLKELLRRHERTQDLLAWSWERGQRPLLAVGLQKALNGSITFDDLLKHTAVLPGFYLSKFREQAKLISEQATAIALNLTDVQLADARGARGTKPRRENPLVLVVEDDPDQRSILEMVFRGAKFQVKGAENGAEAIHSIEREVPDVIVTDLMMPVMDGAALVAHLKGHPVFRHVPILVLTVVSDSGKEYNLLTMGADDYCEKTIQRNILLRRVEKLAQR